MFVARMAAAERRIGLIEAAKRVIVRQGVAAATTRAVAAEAGMSLASLHYVFESQHELMREVVVSAADLQNRWFEAVEMPGVPVGDQIAGMLDSLMDWVTTHRNEELAGYEIANYALRTPGLEPLARVRIDSGVAVVRQLVERFQEVYGPIARSADEIAHLVFQLGDGLVLSYLTSGDDTAARRSAQLIAPYLQQITFGESPSAPPR